MCETKFHSVSLTLITSSQNVCSVDLLSMFIIYANQFHLIGSRDILKQTQKITYLVILTKCGLDPSKLEPAHSTLSHNGHYFYI